MNVVIKQIRLQNYKGCKDASYLIGRNSTVSGANGTGKTTIATAHYWLWCDKDYGLHSNPPIRPIGSEECLPRVEEVLEIGGKEITIAKQQKRKVGKPDDKGISKVTLTNTYTINEVPKTERDFKAYLSDLKVDFELFLPLSHPDVFVGQKATDMRKVLFDMVSEKSDKEIADLTEGAKEVSELLAAYTSDEIQAMQNATLRKIKENYGKEGEILRAKIEGLENAKVDIDVAEQELAKSDLERRIAEIDAKIKDAGSAVSDLKSEEMRLQFDMSAIMQTMNSELADKRRELEDAKYEASQAFTDAHDKISDNNKQIANNKLAIEAAEKRRSELGAEYNAEKAKVFDETPYLFHEEEWQFDENSTICKSCGQTLPADKIEQIKADFEVRKVKAKADAEKRLADAKDRFVVQHNSDLEEIKAHGFKQKDIIEDLTAKNASLQAEIEALKKQEQEALAKQNELAKQLEELPAEADYSQNEEYVKSKVRHDEVVAEIAKADSLGHDELIAQFEHEKKELQAELDSAKENIAQASNNARIDEQVSVLREKQKEYEQSKADCEKILYQLDLISRKKNELLTSEINSHFDVARWQLFEYQKNGGYKDCCKPVIDGKCVGESTNTGREVLAKLDIIKGLQRFYKQNYPVFLDAAECLSEETRKRIEMDCQMIYLCVTDNELMVEEVR